MNKVTGLSKGQAVTLITTRQFEILLPLACSWAAQQEWIILKRGVPLTEQQLTDARAIGVQAPDQVRLLRVEHVPLPEHPALAAAAKATGLISHQTAGLTLRHGIFVRGDLWGNRHLIAHELVHAAQYERLGGFECFLRAYLLECITPPGYPYGPMEQEAILTSAVVCGR